MIIVNKTDCDLFTDRYVTIKPNDTYTWPENVFDTMNVHSDVGSLIIICEYTERLTKTFGIIDAIVDKDNNTLTIVKRW